MGAFCSRAFSTYTHPAFTGWIKSDVVINFNKHGVHFACTGMPADIYSWVDEVILVAFSNLNNSMISGSRRTSGKRNKKNHGRHQTQQWWPPTSPKAKPKAHPMPDPCSIPLLCPRWWRGTDWGRQQQELRLQIKKKTLLHLRSKSLKKKIPCTESIQVPTSLGLSPKNDEHLKDIESTLAAVHIPYTCKQWLFFFLPE